MNEKQTEDYQASQEEKEALAEKLIKIQGIQQQTLDKTTEHQLTVWEVKEVRTELNKLVGTEYHKLELILRKLAFFKKFNQTTCIEILKSSKFVPKKNNEVIFRQGDYGDNMYVILYGSIGVRIAKTTNYGTEENQVVCLYDGQHFGDLAIIGFQRTKKSVIEQIEQIRTIEEAKQAVIELKRKEYMDQKMKAQQMLESLKNKNSKSNSPKASKVATQKQSWYKLKLTSYNLQEQGFPYKAEENEGRLATCVTLEDTFLLEIPRNCFKRVMIASIESDIDKKLKCFEPFNLIPLANTLTSHTYTIGEVILNEGEVINSWCIIGEGRIRLVKTQIQKINNQPFRLNEKMKSGLANFNCGTYESEAQSKKHLKTRKLNKFVKYMQNKNNDNLKNYEIIPVEKSLKRLYSFCKQNLNQDNMPPDEFISLIEYDNLGKGEMFGSRCLYIDDEAQRTSKLTFVSDSFTCEVYKLEKSNLKYLPDFLLRSLLESLKCCTDNDDIDPQEEEIRNKEWVNQREKIFTQELEHIYNSKATANHYKKI